MAEPVDRVIGMKPDQGPGSIPGSQVRVEQALRSLGIETEIVVFPQGTRTSADAARAIGCSVAQIAKSVVFRALASGLPVVVVASGINRVCEQKLGALIGEPVGRADAEFVRKMTGFVIGGVAPVGHLGPLYLLVDEDLQSIDPLWAAAGTPNSVFKIGAAQLAALPGARVADIKLGS